MRVKKKQLIYICSLIMFNLLCFSQMASIKPLALIFTIGLIMPGLILPCNDLGIYMFATLPFFNVMNANMGSVSLYYILTGIILFRLLKKNKITKLRLKILVVMLFLLLTIYNITALKDYLQWIFRLLPFILLLDVDCITKYIKEEIFSYSISMLIASFWGWLMLQKGVYIYTKGYVYVSTGQTTTRFAGLVGDAVIYGGQIIILIALLSVILLKEKKERRRCVVLMGSLGIFGALTYSKSYYLCLVILIIFIYISWLQHREINMNFVILNLFVIGGISISLMAFYYGVLHSGLAFFVRIRTRLLATDLTTGRTEIWLYYWNWCTEHITSVFKGMNLSEYKEVKTIGTHHVKYTHNLYLETIVVFGLIESIVLFAWILKWIRKTYKKCHDFISFVPLIMVLIIGMTVHGHFEYSFYLNFLLVLTCVKGLGLGVSSIRSNGDENIYGKKENC